MFRFKTEEKSRKRNEVIKINRTARGRTEHCHYHLISFKKGNVRGMKSLNSINAPLTN